MLVSQNSRLVLLLILSISFLSSAFTSIEQYRWITLGKKKVSYGLDKDEIFVGAHEGPFRKIKLNVHRSPINLHKVAIHYTNGDVQVKKVRRTIRPGQSTGPFDLKGNRRGIQKVVLWYDTKNRARSKALVDLYGAR